MNELDKCVETLNLKRIKEANEKSKNDGLEAEQIRTILERTIRFRALKLGNSKCPIEEVNKFIQFVISLAKEDMCSKSLTIQVLQDIFDVSIIKRCEELFFIVEDNISVFKTPFFFDSCKNSILRTCNDLLKRLSRTVDTSFCGRILILLAKSLPLNEKSGLNLPGQFNIGNLTTFEHEKVEKLEEAEETDMEIGEIRDGKDSLDYSLYSKFWEIQSYFSNPNSIYDANAFKKFETILADILTVFSTYKLERPNNTNNPKNSKQNARSSSKTPPIQQNDIKTENGIKAEVMDSFSIFEPSCSQTTTAILNDNKNDISENEFFAKYLTNQKLFNLQIADSTFRRYFLVQCLIIANYLLNRPKKDGTSLTVSQEQVLKEFGEKSFLLLKETYPHGSHFAESIRRILNREKSWANWKAEGCPDLVSALAKEQCLPFKIRPTNKYNPNVIDLGNKVLTRLWSINSDNLAACADPKRNCLPDLKDFVDQGLDELDPEQQVEEKYKSVNDEKYQWMASRYLLYNSEQYMNCVNGDPKAPRQPTARYLEKVIQMTAVTIPSLKSRGEKIHEKLSKIEAEQKAMAEAKAEALKKSKEEALALQKERREKLAAAEEAAILAATAEPLTPEEVKKKSSVSAAPTPNNHSVGSTPNIEEKTKKSVGKPTDKKKSGASGATQPANTPSTTSGGHFEDKKKGNGTTATISTTTNSSDEKIKKIHISNGPLPVATNSSVPTPITPDEKKKNNLISSSSVSAPSEERKKGGAPLITGPDEKKKPNVGSTEREKKKNRISGGEELRDEPAKKARRDSRRTERTNGRAK